MASKSVTRYSSDKVGQLIMTPSGQRTMTKTKRPQHNITNKLKQINAAQNLFKRILDKLYPNNTFAVTVHDDSCKIVFNKTNKTHVVQDNVENIKKIKNLNNSLLNTIDSGIKKNDINLIKTNISLLTDIDCTSNSKSRHDIKARKLRTATIVEQISVIERELKDMQNTQKVLFNNYKSAQNRIYLEIDDDPSSDIINKMKINEKIFNNKLQQCNDLKKKIKITSVDIDKLKITSVSSLNKISKSVVVKEKTFPSPPALTENQRQKAKKLYLDNRHNYVEKYPGTNLGLKHYYLQNLKKFFSTEEINNIIINGDEKNSTPLPMPKPTATCSSSKPIPTATIGTKTSRLTEQQLQEAKKSATCSSSKPIPSVTIGTNTSKLIEQQLQEAKKLYLKKKFSNTNSGEGSFIRSTSIPQTNIKFSPISSISTHEITPEKINSDQKSGFLSKLFNRK